MTNENEQSYSFKYYIMKFYLQKQYQIMAEVYKIDRQ